MVERFAYPYSGFTSRPVAPSPMTVALVGIRSETKRDAAVCGRCPIERFKAGRIRVSLRQSARYRYSQARGSGNQRNAERWTFAAMAVAFATSTLALIGYATDSPALIAGTWNMLLARSSPIVLISIADGSSRAWTLNSNHTLALTCREREPSTPSAIGRRLRRRRGRRGLVGPVSNRLVLRRRPTATIIF
jgi:hypothetical protein